jgi:hypothetical protein
MGPPLVVVAEPGIEVGRQLLGRLIDLLAKGDPVELVQQGAMETLADAVIRYVILDAFSSAVLRGRRRYGEAILDVGHREHGSAGGPPTNPGLRARARYMAASGILPDAPRARISRRRVARRSRFETVRSCPIEGRAIP